MPKFCSLLLVALHNVIALARAFVTHAPLLAWGQGLG